MEPNRITVQSEQLKAFQAEHAAQSATALQMMKQHRQQSKAFTRTVTINLDLEEGDDG